MSDLKPVAMTFFRGVIILAGESLGVNRCWLEPVDEPLVIEGVDVEIGVGADIRLI